MLGRSVSLMGKVVDGDKRGKSLGFPTANVCPNGEVLPPLGVYAVHVLVDNKKYKGMANLGRRPSFTTKDGSINIEVHLFNFKRRIYGKEIIIEFVKKIRDETVFKTKDDLIHQLKKDKGKVTAILK